jgi:hypothetical protein
MRRLCVSMRLSMGRRVSRRVAIWGSAWVAASLERLVFVENADAHTNQCILINAHERARLVAGAADVDIEGGRQRAQPGQHGLGRGAHV